MNVNSYPVLPNENYEERNFRNYKPLSFKKACEYLGISKSALYKLTHLKKIPYYKPNGKMIYFIEDELQEWVFRNRIKTNNEIQKEVINRSFRSSER